MPRAFAAASIEPCPQNGSMTVVACVCACRNATTMSHAAVPIARDHDMSPSSGNTSGVDAPAASRSPRDAHSTCANAGRPNVVVPGATRHTILCQSSALPAASIPAWTMWPLSIHAPACFTSVW